MIFALTTFYHLKIQALTPDIYNFLFEVPPIKQVITNEKWTDSILSDKLELLGWLYITYP